jgi:RND superfamily putative drug exporter
MDTAGRAVLFAGSTVIIALLGMLLLGVSFLNGLAISFAIAFGLSMDYEVFLISRIHEEWNRHRDPSRAVVDGLATTGRVITAAATIMICVFLAFVLLPERQVKMFGLSLASAVFLDAFVIRSLLLPAVLELLGRSTWWFPERLGTRLPRLAPEPAPRPAAEATEAG